MNKVLFVCTGNTCRSSMAEALSRQNPAWEVRSAGVAASDGSLASPQAVEVMARRGIDLRTHRSQPVSEELLGWADLVLTMTRQHKEILYRHFPDMTHKVYTLKEYALGHQHKDHLLQQLHDVYDRVENKRHDFAALHTPGIAELQQRRGHLIQELEEVEQRLAELQSSLREELAQELKEISLLEAQMTDDNVEDPFGQDADVYASCAEEIESLLKTIWADMESE